jgi:hypothetical protein
VDKQTSLAMAAKIKIPAIAGNRSPVYQLILTNKLLAAILELK